MSLAPDAPRLPEAVQVEQTHLRLPSQPSWIEPAVEYLKHKALLCGACQEARAGKLVVALHEALNNAIVHGNLEVSSALKERADDAYAQALAARAADPRFAERAVDVLVHYDRERCQWAITDEGPGFNADAALRRAAGDEPNLLLASGRGIVMMRALMDELRYEAGGRRVILTLHRSSAQEGRRHERLPVLAPLRVVPVGPDGKVRWDEAYAAVARDLSPEGLGLLQAQLAISDRVIVGVQVGDQTVYLPAEVRHYRSVGPDMVELGCRFQAPAPPGAPAGDVGEAVGRLLERARGAVPADERRLHPRVPYSEPVEILTGPGIAPVRGYPRNLSKGGIAFITTVALPAAFTIVFPSRGEEPPLRLRAETVRCARVQEGFYDVSARLVGFAGAAAVQ
jgi:anti-sigma regulatory factor (Ser/Thr protein kinase)